MTLTVFIFGAVTCFLSLMDYNKKDWHLLQPVWFVLSVLTMVSAAYLRSIGW